MKCAGRCNRQHEDQKRRDSPQHPSFGASIKPEIASLIHSLVAIFVSSSRRQRS